MLLFKLTSRCPIYQKMQMSQRKLWKNISKIVKSLLEKAKEISLSLSLISRKFSSKQFNRTSIFTKSLPRRSMDFSSLCGDKRENRLILVTFLRGSWDKNTLRKWSWREKFDRLACVLKSWKTLQEQMMIITKLFEVKSCHTCGLH